MPQFHPQPNFYLLFDHRIMAEGRTDLAGALKCVATDLAKSPFQDRFVCVLSDGEPNQEAAVRSQIARLTEDEVALVGLGLGPKTEKLGEFFPVSRVNLATKQLPAVLIDVLLRRLIPVQSSGS